MSGIIEINGKRYDEDGNLVIDKNQAPKSIDGVAPKKVQHTKLNEVLKGHGNTPAHTSVTSRVHHRPPTEKLKRSLTLNRLSVHKPNHHVNHGVTVIKNKKPDNYTGVNVARHSDIKRLSQAPAHHISEQKTAHQPHSSYVPKKKTEEMIQAQLEAANAHLMTFKKPTVVHHVKKRLSIMPKAHRRFMLASSIAAMVVLVGGALIYINLPGISIMIASKRAGFTAYIPSFTPNGYRIKNPVGYTPGRIVINFKSNTNDMRYTIEQKPTGWTSDTLREQVTSSSGTQYQTQYANGLTIFFTNDDTATWVDRGILFTFQGDSGLSTDQIASIAASM